MQKRTCKLCTGAKTHLQKTHLCKNAPAKNAPLKKCTCKKTHPSKNAPAKNAPVQKRTYNKGILSYFIIHCNKSLNIILHWNKKERKPTHCNLTITVTGNSTFPLTYSKTQPTVHTQFFRHFFSFIISRFSSSSSSATTS